MRVLRDPLLRNMWVGLGVCALALALVGVVLPVLPTTPFLIVAAALFSRGSPRLHSWLRQLPLVGKLLGSYTNRQVPAVGVILATTVWLWSGLGLTGWLVLDSWLLRGVLIVVALGIPSHLMCLRLRRLGRGERS